MTQLRHRLMLEEAHQRLSDAEALSNTLRIGERTDSPYLLRLLGFELLLKLLYEKKLHKKAPIRHEYGEIFAQLPQDVRGEVLALALDHAGPSKLTTAPDVVLKELGKNFISLRYPFDRYDGMSEEQYASLGDDWVTRGALDEEASFRYHPTELHGLIHALSQLVA